MINIEQRLIELSAQYGLPLSAQQTAAFQTYMELLLDWNEKMNLTAITEPQQVVEKHFLDSLLLIKAVEIPKNGKVIDVGTGAGFPGIPLLLYRPDIRLTLLDSLQKRLTFLQAVCDALGLSAELIHARAEEGSRQPKLREQFDLACARAVAPLPVLCEYCVPFVRRGGAFAAMKGPGAAEESVAAAKAISLLGAHAESTQSFTLPDGSERNIILCRKIAATSDKYPRHGSKIAKTPL
ncbi:16S rRNA (guanine(527)-N(7))-methyltransferase RsmG [Faecalispora anaeroviscerum]|uniref:16S rRNA (guanine(527)-N(7))-methyltransferase RsmG n=1 Tax=Faecalispora anaeroviscerum TaxID=2991836 RepID=UPI0024BBC63B|nr:16S rRNA (guanine(527)-N(7))-methyltransferase RsmG [Faecalispora anaeroviscerum]